MYRNKIRFRNALYAIFKDVFPCKYCLQGSHRLKKYLNMKGFLEKSLKMKFALNHHKALKSTCISLFSVRLNPVNVD